MEELAAAVAAAVIGGGGGWGTVMPGGTFVVMPEAMPTIPAVGIPGVAVEHGNAEAGGGICCVM